MHRSNRPSFLFGLLLRLGLSEVALNLRKLRTFVTDRGGPYTDTPFLIQGILKSAQTTGDDPNLRTAFDSTYKLCPLLIEAVCNHFRIFEARFRSGVQSCHKTSSGTSAACRTRSGNKRCAFRRRIPLFLEMLFRGLC